ncbi:MAG: YIP1 family protein [Actinomycetota bacterium]
MTSGHPGRSRGDGPARRHAHASVRLGLTLRSVVLRPREGYAAAMRTGERRARAGERLPEGVTPYVLALAGGAAGMCLWLKFGALAGLRHARVADFDSGVLIAALLVGVVLGLAGQVLWGAVGSWCVARLGGRARARDLRLAWGASALPLVGVLVLLAPDLILAGPGVFTIDPLGDAIATAWAALSIAVGIALAVWSLWLFVRGVEVASGLRLRRAVPAVLAGAACFALLAGGLAMAGTLVASKTVL